MSWRERLELVDEHLQVFLFGLMGMGLLLASAFLWHGLITGDNWVAVCGILFGTNAVGAGVSRLGAKPRAAADSGNQKPV